MKLYLCTNNIVQGYDTYDSIVVAAETEEDARQTHPNGDWNERLYFVWCKAEQVEIKLLGTAIQGTEAGIICASFNAG